MTETVEQSEPIGIVTAGNSSQGQINRNQVDKCDSSKKGAGRWYVYVAGTQKIK